MRRLGTTLIAAAALTLLPGSAYAAVAEVRPAGGSRTLHVDDRLGEPNELEVVWRRTTQEFEIHDAVSLLEPGVGCRAVGAQSVACQGDMVRRVEVSGGDGDDVITDRVPPVPGSSVHYVQLEGGEGDDHLQGSTIDESFDGGPGGDYMSGGRGTDTVTESQTDGEGGGVVVTLDARANDGLPGEGDNIRGNIEYIVGGPGEDTLSGNNGDHHMFGGPGSDLIRGKGGDDDLAGGDGVDAIEGGAGIDHIDAVDPRQGDGRDQVMCGNGWDEGVGDPQDLFETDCEQYLAGGVRHRNAPTRASGRPPGLPAIVGPVVIVRRTSLIVFAGCRQTAACSGTVKVAASVRSRSGAIRRPTLARGKFKAPAGEFKRVRLRVSKRMRKYLPRARRGTATVNAKGEFGGRRVTRRRVRLR